MEPLAKFPVSEQLLCLRLQETIIPGLGYMVVANHGNCYAIVDEGTYSIKMHGFTNQGTEDKRKQLDIFRGLITKYRNFERNGYKYHYSESCW